MNFEELCLSNVRRPLLIASTGGHLTQLYKYAHLFDFQNSPVWVTFDHPQSRSLLKNHEVVYVPYIRSRDFIGILRAMPDIRKTIKKYNPDLVVSTGAALALSGLPMSLLQRRRTIYIESVSRFNGPSLTGRILQYLPKLERYSQHSGWANKRWPLIPSILESFHPFPALQDIDAPLRVFISLGTIRPYRFDSLVEQLIKIIPQHFEVRIQYGSTYRDFGPWESFESQPATQIAQHIEWADVVVSHSGVGTALQMLDQGKAPVLGIRRSSRGEHIDDHQAQIANFLIEKGLAYGGEATDIELETLLKSAKTKVASLGHSGEG